MFGNAGRHSLRSRLFRAPPGGCRGRKRETAAALCRGRNTSHYRRAMAEHRFRMRTSEVETFAAALLSGSGDASVTAVLKDLDAHRGAGIVMPGEHQPPRVHAIAHALNQKYGNAGKTVIYTNPVEANPIDQIASIVELVRDMNSGAVDTLLILGGNPVYDAPADLNFLEALKKIAFRAHLGLYSNETAAWCHWHVPEAHYLESWSDARAYDGTASIVQPLIAPLYDGKTPHDILNVLLNRTGKSAHDTVQDYWRAQHKGADFEDFWKTSLFYGVIDGTAFRRKSRRRRRRSRRRA